MIDRRATLEKLLGTTLVFLSARSAAAEADAYDPAVARQMFLDRVNGRTGASQLAFRSPHLQRAPRANLRDLAEAQAAIDSFVANALSDPDVYEDGDG